MNWLLSNLKLVGILAAITAVFGGGAYTGRQFEKAHAEHALQAQETALIAQCDKDKAITTGVSHEYENQLSAVNQRLAVLKRLHPKACVPATGTPGGRNAGTGSGKLAGQDGSNVESFYDFAGEAETYRIRLIACQGFINAERKK